jgi:hypothetical protein
LALLTRHSFLLTAFVRYIMSVTYAIKVSKQKSTGFTPFNVTHLRHPSAPKILNEKNESNEIHYKVQNVDDGAKCAADHNATTEESLQIHRIVAEHIEKSRLKQRTQHARDCSRKAKIFKLEVGDHVLLNSMRKSSLNVTV